MQDINFNSIKVRLELNCSILQSHSVADFNSIKVRLELFKAKARKFIDLLFQFHKGTIRTVREKNGSSNYEISIP